MLLKTSISFVCKDCLMLLDCLPTVSPQMSVSSQSSQGLTSQGLLDVSSHPHLMNVPCTLLLLSALETCADVAGWPMDQLSLHDGVLAWGKLSLLMFIPQSSCSYTMPSILNPTASPKLTLWHAPYHPFPSRNAHVQQALWRIEP